MRKVKLRMDEQYKYDIIKKLVETNGNKKNAAIKLNCTVPTIDRLIIKYKSEGKAGFGHGNRNRKPASTIPDVVKNKVIDLYRTKYSGANLLHFSQLLARHEDIHVSDNYHQSLAAKYGYSISQGKTKNCECTECRS